MKVYVTKHILITSIILQMDTLNTLYFILRDVVATFRTKFDAVYSECQGIPGYSRKRTLQIGERKYRIAIRIFYKYPHACNCDWLLPQAAVLRLNLSNVFLAFRHVQK